ncbi:MAG: hypothetical protein AB7D96_07660 [Arcobacteraceae bacterium]
METKEIVRAKRTNPKLEKRHLDQIRPIDHFYFAVARFVTFNNTIIEAINRGRTGVILLSIFVSWIIGNYSSHAVFTVVLIFCGLLIRTAYHFDGRDYDDLYQQWKERQKGEENSNQWSFQKMKPRLKWYGLFFMIMFIISIWQTQTAGIAFTLNIILGLVFGCFIATIVTILLSEYTIGGLHRNRKLHYVLIGGLIAYAFARYIFDYIG